MKFHADRLGLYAAGGLVHVAAMRWLGWRGLLVCAATFAVGAAVATIGLAGSG